MGYRLIDQVIPLKILVVLFSYFKISLWMVAYRTDIRCFCSNYDMTAVSALPDLYAAFLKYLSGLHIIKKRTISLFVCFFDCCNAAEFL